MKMLAIGLYAAILCLTFFDTMYSQDALIYKEEYYGGAPALQLSIGQTGYVETDDDGISIEILNSAAAVRVRCLISGNYHGEFSSYFLLYTERDVPKTVGTDQYTNVYLKIECITKAQSEPEMPQPEVWIPIDGTNANPPVPPAPANRWVLMLRKAFIYENAEDLGCCHGPWGSLGLNIHHANLLYDYGFNFTSIEEDYCEKPDDLPATACAAFVAKYPVISSARFPGPVYTAGNPCCGLGCLWFCDDPQSEWLDGSWGVYYSNCPVYVWDPSDTTITVLMREGDETNLDDFLGAILVRRNSTEPILFKLWMGGWVVLQNVQIPSSGYEPSVYVANKYWFPTWDGVYPHNTGVIPHHQFDQYLPLPGKTIAEMQDYLGAGETVGILGGSFPSGVFNKPMTYVAACVPATSGANILIGVQLFDQPNYRGSSKWLDTDKPNLNSIGFADVAASVRIYGIQSALLYDYKDYDPSGGILTVTQDIPDLLPLGWKNRVGSVKIIR